MTKAEFDMCADALKAAIGRHGGYPASEKAAASEATARCVEAFIRLHQYRERLGAPLRGEQLT